MYKIFDTKREVKSELIVEFAETRQDFYQVLLNNKNDNVIKQITTAYDAEGEVASFLKKVKGAHVEKTLIIFGIGTAAYLDKLVKKFKNNSKIIIFEPSKAIFEKAWERIKDIEFEIEIHFIIGSLIDSIEKIKNYIFGSSILLDAFEYHHYTVYNKVFEEEYNYYVRLIKETLERHMVNVSTLKYFVELHAKNRILNYSSEREIKAINIFSKAFMNKPALIVSAGPSLSKQLDKIQDFNGLIIAGGRTVGILREKGIEPDIVVVIDGSEESYRIISDSMECKAPLFTYIVCPNKIIEQYAGPIVLMQHTNELTQVNDQYAEVQQINSGYSVANTSFSVAEFLGCDPIIVIGQDLAYTDDKLHAEEVKKGRDNLVSSDKYEVVRGYYGGQVKTSITFKQFKSVFEEMIDLYEGTFINATEGGAYIEGAQHLSFEEVITKCNNQEKINKSILEKTFEDNECLKSGLSFEIIKDKLKRVKKIVKEAKDLTIDLKLKFNRGQKINSILEKMDTLDKRMMEADITNIIMDEILNSIRINYSVNVENRELNNDSYQSILEQNISFYEHLYKEINKYIGYIEEECCE